MNLIEWIDDDVRASYASRLGLLAQHGIVEHHASIPFAGILSNTLSQRRACVLFDTRTYDAAGATCCRALEDSGFDVTELLLPDPNEKGPVCDDHTLRWIVDRLPPVDIVVAVGSGVINDLAKWTACANNVAYAVFATASSMNGYSSSNVAATVQGVKTLVPGRAALAIGADPYILASAPHRLTTAGFGDLLAKAVSIADWILNAMVAKETFCPRLTSWAERWAEPVLVRPEAIASEEPQAIQALFHALVVSGCVMTLHGSSLPASGAEHVISHTLDMMSDADGQPHDLHGRQVGVATIVAAALWEHMLHLRRPTFKPFMPPWDANVWGKSAPAVAEHLSKKTEVIHKTCEKLSASGYWEHIQENVRPHLRSPQWVKDQLARANAAHQLSHIGCSRERFLMALRHASAMRSRLTCLDIVRMAGVVPEVIENIVDRWVA
ncbi:MAG TPA: iron-containing alcohol dehydrogenase [Polyangiaceae bacterium]|jgi:glycerol-1-phosphate dehydrogenase [NAD(P)+]|nr:MAG: Glycerol-1-phosphate dehydrogenase (NAD(P)+) [Deltaproteobacteria bacterium ADurb.Bin207]HNS97992.1 iron-containing alcohol dehydrogenase [Polyangiaceae bacterium]HNZ24685.1 iron-containing alcohol dehydrogenase [Polyangiaceae bacterium]HOD23433.1 iron-containing alcohol dehydrogenase [Polyangiaceae bacterium]HOE50001.1 iron-containing alcohol dehydrogenase [Polyangiaceae bacterium]